MVSGVAIFDYNSDGKPDIYFVNGARQPQLDKPDPSYYNRLYRNDGGGRFTDVTLAAGVRGDGFATGVAAGTLTMMDGKTCSSPASTAISCIAIEATELLKTLRSGWG
jgi:hypothetical protein